MFGIGYWPQYKQLSSESTGHMVLDPCKPAPGLHPGCCLERVRLSNMILEPTICISVPETSNWRAYQMVWWAKGGPISAKSVPSETTISLKPGSDPTNLTVGNVLVRQCLPGSPRIVTPGGYDRSMPGRIMGHRSGFEKATNHPNSGSPGTCLCLRTVLVRGMT
jgi:hypothetical protein